MVEFSFCITMRQGPVNNVPISIKSLESNVRNLWADRAMTNNHFGDTPIFGTIETVNSRGNGLTKNYSKYGSQTTGLT
jgi:hypothetical protein